MLSRRQRLAILFSLCGVAIVGMLFVPPIPQPGGYHNFVDTRTLLGVPNFWNVVSNVPFLLVGIMGFVVVARGTYSGGLPSLRVAYGIFFVGVTAVCFGSGYYHWSPSNATLAWDRLPMSVAFMAFVCIIVAEHIDEHTAKVILWPLLALGVFSVWYWDYTEQLGRGDLRWYGLVQFLTLVVIALTLWMFPSRFNSTRYVWAMFAGYAAAKVFEGFDRPVYAALGEQMSGHALKHMAAAAGMAFFVVALRKRKIAVR